MLDYNTLFYLTGIYFQEPPCPFFEMKDLPFLRKSKYFKDET